MGPVPLSPRKPEFFSIPALKGPSLRSSVNPSYHNKVIGISVTKDGSKYLSQTLLCERDVDPKGLDKRLGKARLLGSSLVEYDIVARLLDLSGGGNEWDERLQALLESCHIVDGEEEESLSVFGKPKAVRRG